jgi:hypothetical protein
MSAQFAGRAKPTIPLDDDELDCLSVEQFCDRNGFSVKAFYKHFAMMPPSFLVGSRRLITRENNERWRRERKADPLIVRKARRRK